MFFCVIRVKLYHYFSLYKKRNTGPEQDPDLVSQKRLIKNIGIAFTRYYLTSSLEICEINLIISSHVIRGALRWRLEFDPDPWWLTRLCSISMHHIRWQLHQPFHSQPSGPDALLPRLGLPELAHGTSTYPHTSGPHGDCTESRFCFHLLALTHQGTTLSKVSKFVFTHVIFQS